MYLYHYFDKSTGPFKNLSDLPIEEAKRLLQTLKTTRPKSFLASRDDSYMDRRIAYESLVCGIFKDIGGKPVRTSPHFMTVEHSDWLYSWYENPAFVKIPIEEFDLSTLSFTYGDMHPTFSPIVTDGREYRKKLYMYPEILQIIEKYGLPQNNPPAQEGETGHPFYVEVQVWSDETVKKYISSHFWEEL